MEKEETNAEQKEKKLEELLELYKSKEDAFFDIRKYGLYQKMGGIDTFLKIVFSLKSKGVGVRLNKTLVSKHDLKIILAEYNELNPEKNIDIDEYGVMRLNDNQDKPAEPDKTSPLEISILSAVEGLQESKEIPIKMAKELIPEKVEISIADRYYSVITANRIDINDIGLANSLLKEMINQKVNNYTRETWNQFLRKTNSFVSKHNHRDLYDTIYLVFEYAAQIHRGNFSEESLKNLNDISGRLSSITFLDKEKDKMSERAKRNRLREINKRAFKTHLRIGDLGRNITYIRGAGWHYLLNTEKQFKISEDLTESEKEKLLDEGLDMCKSMLADGTPKDVVTYINANYYTACFNFEKYQLKKYDTELRTAIVFLKYAQEDLIKIKNQNIVKDLSAKIKLLHERIYG